MNPTPAAVSRALKLTGEHLTTWRKLRRLTAAQVADRAGVSVNTVLRVESGAGATLENVLRITRALGVMDAWTTALDPYEHDVGRLRADENLPERVRPPRAQP